eukprot:5935187-Pyramimonas_sp.AAC.1
MDSTAAETVQTLYSNGVGMSEYPPGLSPPYVWGNGGNFRWFSMVSPVLSPAKVLDVCGQGPVP